MRKIIQFICVLSVVALLACYVTADAKKRSTRKQQSSSKVSKTQKYSVPDISNLTDFYNQVKKSGTSFNIEKSSSDNFEYPFLGYKDCYMSFDMFDGNEMNVLIYFNDYNVGLDALHNIESYISKRYGHPLKHGVINDEDSYPAIEGFKWYPNKPDSFISCIFERNIDYKEKNYYNDNFIVERIHRKHFDPDTQAAVADPKTSYIYDTIRLNYKYQIHIIFDSKYSGRNGYNKDANKLKKNDSKDVIKK